MRCFFSFSSTSVAAPARLPRRRRTAWRGAPGASRGRSRGGLLDLGLDLAHPALDRVLRAAVDDRRVVLGRDDATCRMKSSAVTESSLRPISSLMTVPPVRTAMSRSISLRRSPKPGALTARTWIVPRSLFTTSVASASPSTSSAMMRIGLPSWTPFSRAGSMSGRSRSSCR